ncbi:MAG: hypothetical protein ACTSR2_13215 [Candidatus Hodarchaeales archaeon]
MLILSKRRTLIFKLKSFGILLPVVCLSIMCLLVFVNLTFLESLPSSYRQPLSSSSVFDGLPRIILSLFLIVGLVISFELSFYWIPSLSNMVGKYKGQMIWVWNHFFILERAFLLEFEDIHIIFRRKRFSFSGILLRELLMEVHLPHDKLHIRDFSDFIQKEKIIQTAKDQIIIKTVRLEHIPLYIQQIQLLSRSLNPFS